MLSMFLPLMLLIVLLLGAWFWRASMQAKEIAIAIAQRRCEKEGWQLLDETVAIKSIKLRRGYGGSLTLLRTYQFEYYDGDDRRKRDKLALLGNTSVEPISQTENVICIKNRTCISKK